MMKLTIGRMRKEAPLTRKKRKKTQSLMKRLDRFERKRVRLTTPEGEDRISELPDEILVSILSRLTLREAARTSVLSKRWRYLWTCISALNFDAVRNLTWRWGSHYNNWVSSVLAQHRGPNIDEFRVYYDDLTKKSSSHIDGWIEFVLSNRVQTIELNLVDGKWRGSLRRYTFPYRLLGLSALGSCLNNSYNMNTRTFVGFKSLKTLSLKAVNVVDEAVGYFLSNCPLLEQLFLHDNNALRNLKVVGPSLMLRHLEVVRCFPVETIEICDTNLVSFTYARYEADLLSFTYAGDEPEILLKNVPLLVEVSINCDMSMHSAKAMLRKLSCCLPQLEILQLAIDHKRQKRLRTYSLPELKNLKQFVLVVDRWSDACLLGFLAMIKKSPNLQRFVLQLRSQVTHKHDKERKTARRDLREAVEYHHHCLKVVEIAGYCSSCDFELVKQIIENAVTLEKIIIDPRSPEMDPQIFASCDVKHIRSCAEQQLRTQVPPGVELVIL